MKRVSPATASDCHVCGTPDRPADCSIQPCGHRCCAECARSHVVRDRGPYETRCCPLCQAPATTYRYEGGGDEGEDDEWKMPTLPEMPTGGDDWNCLVCDALYDLDRHLPVRVAACYASPPNAYVSQSDQDRGTSAPCGHRLCQQCATRMQKEGHPCCICRAYPARYDPDRDLIDAIATAGPASLYPRLAAALNAAGDAEEEAIDARRSEQKARREAESLQRRLADIEDQSRLLEEARQDAAMKSLHASQADRRCEQARAREGQTRQQLDRVLTINKLLFDEVIRLRLAAVDANTLDPVQLGLSTAAEPPDRHLINVQVPDTRLGAGSRKRGRHPGGIRLVYDRTTPQLAKRDRGVFERINALTAGQSADPTERAPETEREAIHDWALSCHDGSVMVRSGDNWLARYLASTYSPVEAVFDREDAEDELHQRYRRITPARFEQAVAFYRSLPVTGDNESDRVI